MKSGKRIAAYKCDGAPEKTVNKEMVWWCGGRGFWGGGGGAGIQQAPKMHLNDDSMTSGPG